MTEAPPTPAQEPAFGAESERVLSRSREGRMLTGVCAGLGRYTSMDPVLFRVGFAILVLGSGIGIILYVAAFLLMREPGGRPGYLEQWTGRVFDTETVLALLAAVFAFGVVLNLASGGIDTGTIVVGTLLAIALLAAHSRGVDLLSLAKTLPERMTGRRGMAPAPADMFVRSHPFGPSSTDSYGPPGSSAPIGSHGPTSPSAPSDMRSQEPEKTGTGGYRRLSDLAKEARTSTHGSPGQYSPGPPVDYSSSEPFAPHGPYSTQSPQNPSGPYGTPNPYGMQGTLRREPYAPAEPPRRRVRQKQPKSFIGGLTVCLALIVGGIMVSVQQSSTGSVNLPVVGGAVLITIGAGLLVTTWYGRGAALVAAGTIVALLLVAGSTMHGIPQKIGSYTWHPIKVTQVTKDYAIGFGEGKLDLSDLALAPGARTRFSASVSIGRITVVVPSTVRVEVHGYARLGEIKIDHELESGADIRLDRNLKPEVTGTGDVATIELHVKAGLGDVEVRRAA